MTYAAPPDLLAIARHLDRVRRAGAAAREGVIVKSLTGPAGGWFSGRPGVDPGEYPSVGLNRIFWISTAWPIAPADMDGAFEAARAMDCRRMFIWIAPWAHNAAVESALAAAGARRAPYVKYIALLRDSATPLPAALPTPLTTRIIRTGEADTVLPQLRPWYSDAGIARAGYLIRHDQAEAHVAFDGARPVAIGLLSREREGEHTFAYLSSAGTDPAFQRRGGQTALIHSRIRRAAELGIPWCTCETNTAVPISLNNLHRAGFADAIEWCVYRWDDPG
jgi:GNAT superfamily N-acetyltransferase